MAENGTMDEDPDQFCLRWNNHSSNFITVFDQLLKTESFTDVTVAAEGVQIKCHKMVLAACSAYFQELFMETPCEHPIVILQNVKLTEIKSILNYMYRGEVHVLQDDLPGLLKAASSLKIKGLVEEPQKDIGHRGNTETEMTPPPDVNHDGATNGQPLSNGYVLPLHFPPHIPSNLLSFMGKLPLERGQILDPSYLTLQAGLPESQHPISGPPPRSQHSILGTSYDSARETSPLSRKKYMSVAAISQDTPILRNVLAHMDGTAADRQEVPLNTNSNGSFHESDRRSSAELSEPMQVENESRRQRSSPAYANVGVNVHVNGTVNGTGKNKAGATKPEWKRYKQYTRENIQEAMEAVRDRYMSALQAARKYGVPSRTLYDKLKKAGILPSRGAGASRQRVREREESSCVDNGSARFPYSGSTNGSVYGSRTVHESEHETNGALVIDMSTRSPSPARPAHPFVAPAVMNQDDQVEDLSIARRSNNTTPVIVTPPASIKQENPDANGDIV